MNEQELISLAETGNDKEANEAMAILRKDYDPTYVWCADCDYLVVKEKDCCNNKNNETMKKPIQTPIQKLIDKWEQNKGSHIPDSPTLQEFINDAKAMLEEEKEFIRLNYWEGGQDLPQEWSEVEYWYDETFNAKEK